MSQFRREFRWGDNQYVFYDVAALDCVSPFEMLDGVGCVHVIAKSMPTLDARKSCPAGSSLASVYNDAQIAKLFDYIKPKAAGKLDIC